MRQILLQCLMFFLAGTLTLNAQCPDGDVSLFSQSDVDNFVINHPDCTQIDGNLTIWSFIGEIINLDALESITEISGDLSVGYNNQLSSLSGLGNLVTVSGSLTIQSNPLLTSLEVLNNNVSGINSIMISANNSLTSLDGLGGIMNSDTESIQIQNNMLLNDITALSGINGNVEGDLIISGNDNLTSLQGLNNIQNIGGQLRIQNNNSLTNLADLESLTQAGMLLIFNNPSLSTLQGLNNLQNIGELRLQENNSLIDLTGLNGITSISGGIDIQNNASLTSLYGINNAQTHSLNGELIIKDNPSLTELRGMESIIATSGLVIENNEVLSSLGFLGNLSEVAGPISIKNNEMLTSLSGLELINPSHITSLTLESSESLSTCAIPSICQYLSNGGEATISGNATGCNSLEEISDNCETLPSCTNGNVNLLTQTQVDSFAIVFPDCDEIQGNLIIGHHFIDPGSDQIENLQGLQNITKINGDFTVSEIHNLSNFEYLENLTEVAGNVTIDFKNNLENLEGLNNLETIGNSLILNGSDGSAYPASNLVNLEGLNNLNYIGGRLAIGGGSQAFGHPQLISLQGLENLIQVGGIEILNNPELTDISALTNITNVIENPNIVYAGAGVISIRYNENLTSLEGLENINLANQVQITENETLSSLQGLASLSMTDFLLISNNPSLTNLEGLNNLEAIGGYGMTIGQNESLMSLEGLESLYEIMGDVYIEENIALESLNGLEGLNSISGYGGLNIGYNPLLTSLEGLDNLTEISYNLSIGYNESLETLEGLNSLTSIGNGSIIVGVAGYLLIQENNSLINIEALESLQILKNLISIYDNPQLQSLSGLDLINPYDITSLKLENNPQLSYCSTDPICQYISEQLGETIINGNAQDCNSETEIEAICLLSVDEIDNIEEIILFPVPVKQILNIKTQENVPIEWVKIFDLSGKQVSASSGNQTKINISQLPTGTYLVSVKTSHGLHQEKIIKK